MKHDEGKLRYPKWCTKFTYVTMDFVSTHVLLSPFGYFLSNFVMGKKW